MPVSDKDVVILLRSSPDAEVKKYADDVSMVASLMRVLNVSLDFATATNKAEFTSKLVDKTLALGDVATSISDSTALKVGSLIAGQANATFALADVARTMSTGGNPLRVGVGMTVLVAEKLVMAAGLGNVNKCRSALASLALTTVGAAASAPTGIGAVVGAVAIAASAVEMYGACYADGRGGRDLTFL